MNCLFHNQASGAKTYPHSPGQTSRSRRIGEIQASMRPAVHDLANEMPFYDSEFLYQFCLNGNNALIKIVLMRSNMNSPIFRTPWVRPALIASLISVSCIPVEASARVWYIVNHSTRACVRTPTSPLALGNYLKSKGCRIQYSTYSPSRRLARVTVIWEGTCPLGGGLLDFFTSKNYCYHYDLSAIRPVNPKDLQ